MLIMEPRMSRVNSLKFKQKLTENEILTMRDQIRNEFDQIQLVLRQVSSYMLLVFRYTHT
jgi:hypothetical protein